MREILERYREILREDSGPPADRVIQHARSIASDGRWPDVDYTVDVDEAWTPARHIGRCREMALAWANERHALHGDGQLEGALKRALDDWIQRKYQSSNWWWNQIGVPRAMRDIVVLMGQALAEGQLAGALAVIGQFRVRDTAANLLWSAELALHHGCLSKRADQVAGAARAVEDEIVVGHPEGIQEDYSFFQHGPRLQAFSYGRSYLEIAVDLAWQLRDTPWAFAQKKLDVITGYILEGLQWMCRGTATVPSTLDRTVTRRGWLRRAADLRPWLRRWLSICPSRKDEVEAFLARQEGGGRALVGYLHFACADFTTYQRPAFSFFLKTISDRTLPTQGLHKENLKGQHLHTGDHYLLRDGQEYFDLPPVWDWERLPGLTLASSVPPLQRRAFVGGLGNGRSGLSVMDYERVDEGGGRSLAVRKMWGFHGDLVVCLMGGWRCGGLTGEVYTSLDQCKLREAPRVGTRGEPPQELSEGRHDLEDVLWLLHGGVAYMPLAPASATVWTGPATGSWRSVSGGASAEPVTEPVFCASLRHGSRPEPCGFAIAVAVSLEKAQQLAQQPSWTTLRNEGTCQAIQFEDGTCLAAFWEAGAVEADAISLRVDKPCLALWADKALWLCDPTHAGGTVSAHWQGSVLSAELPPGGRALCLTRSAGALHSS
jgi:chondroitin AC lyase